MNNLLSIEGLSHEGRGISKVDGKIAFVSGALPGEQVDARLIKRHKSFDEFQLTQVHTASSERITPPCDHYTQCGGCDLQHYAVEAQRQFKQETVLQQLQRIARIQPMTVHPIISDKTTGYRRRTRLACRWDQKTKRFSFGFRSAKSNQIVEFRHCLVLTKPLNQLIDALAPVLGRLKSHRQLGHIELVHGGDTSAVALLVRTLRPLPESDLAKLTLFAENHPCALFLQSGDASTLYQHAGPTTPLTYPTTGDQSLQFQVDHFIQANNTVNQQMVAQAIQHLDLSESDQVLELFAGIGNFSIPVAQRGCSLLAIEGLSALTQQAEQNAQQYHLDNLHFKTADLARVEKLDKLTGKSFRFNKLLLDPPRSGAQEVLPLVLKNRKLTHIVYVSCNPGTLARDSKLLHQAGFEMQDLTIADMFPHTHHVESIACFTRK